MQFGKANGRRKYMIGAIAAVAVLVLGTAPLTYSYLTASSDAVVNTFAGGAISLKLDEVLTDSEGNPDASGTRVIENSYKITPGAELTKDPTITVLANSEAAYVFIYVDNNLPEEYFTLDYSDSWIEVASVDTKTLYMYESVAASSDEDYTLDPIFTTVTVSEDLTSEQIEELGELQMTVQAYAVQEEGVTESDAVRMAIDFFEDTYEIEFTTVSYSLDASVSSESLTSPDAESSDTESSDADSSGESETDTGSSGESAADTDSSGGSETDANGSDTGSSDADSSDADSSDTAASDTTDSTGSSTASDSTYSDTAQDSTADDTSGASDDASGSADSTADSYSTQGSDSAAE